MISENWIEVLDRMSRVIKETEIKMRVNGLSLPVELGELSWREYGKHFRICLGTKPLSEHSAHVRAEQFEMLPKLVSAADQAMKSAYGHVVDSQVGI